MNIQPHEARKALETLLSPYQRLTGVILPELTRPDPTSQRERFEGLRIRFGLGSGLEIQELREVLELWGLLLYLHRHSESDVLYADARLGIRLVAREDLPVKLFLQLEGESPAVDFVPSVRAQQIWRSMVSLFENEMELSEQYFVARKGLLELFGVDEAFVKGATCAISLSWKPEEEFAGLIDPMQDAVQTLRSAPEASIISARTRLEFESVSIAETTKTASIDELTAIAHAWSRSSAYVQCKKLAFEIDPHWTNEDVTQLGQILGSEQIDCLTLRIEHATSFKLSFVLIEQLGSVERVVLDIKIESWTNWTANNPEYSCPSVSVDKFPPVKHLVLNVAQAQSMTPAVNAILDGLKSPSGIEAMKNCDIELSTIVDKTSTADIPQLLRLLAVIGERVIVLHTQSYDAENFYFDWMYATTPNAYDLTPLVTACPNLRLLNVQGGVLPGLPELFENENTKLQSLFVRWQPDSAALELATALQDPSTKISHRLVEFGSSICADDVYRAFKLVLEQNRSLRYLRLGNSFESGELVAALRSHHLELLAPEFPVALEILADTKDPQALLALKRMGSDVLSTISNLVDSKPRREVFCR